MSIRSSIVASVVAGLGVACAPGASAADYPLKPIRLIVGFAPGGQGDILARAFAPRLGEFFGQQVLVDNRPGAGGSIAYETAVRANPDGYTLGLVPGGYAANAALYPLAYDPVGGVAPVALVAETGWVVTLNPALPIATLRELMAYDRANPGRLNYGSSGTGSGPHLSTELLNQMTGMRMTHVPYKGSAVALNDLLGGQIQVVFANLPTVIQHFKSNRLHGIAVTAAKRYGAVPDIPTVAETVPGYEAVGWYGFLGPQALPKDVVARWNREINRILQLPDIKERLAVDGLDPLGGTSQAFREVLARDIAKWKTVVRNGNIKAGG